MGNPGGDLSNAMQSSQQGRGAAAYVRAGMKVESKGVGDLAKQFEKLDTHLKSVTASLKALAGTTGQAAARNLAQIQAALGGPAGGTGGYLGQYKPQDLTRGTRPGRPTGQAPAEAAAPAQQAQGGYVAQFTQAHPVFSIGVTAGTLGMAAVDRRFRREQEQAMFAGQQTSWGAMLNMSGRALSSMNRANLPFARSQAEFGEMLGATGAWGVAGNAAGSQAFQQSVTGLIAQSGGTMSQTQALGMYTQFGAPQTERRLRTQLGARVFNDQGNMRPISQIYGDILQGVRTTGGRTLGQLDPARRRQLLQTGMAPGTNLQTQLQQYGLSQEQSQSVVQFGLQQETFRQRGGRGRYDPSDPGHMKLLGLDPSQNLGTSRLQTERAAAEREEEFMQDHIKTMIERNKWEERTTETLQKLDSALGGFYDLVGPLSGIFGRLVGTVGGLIQAGSGLMILFRGLGMGGGGGGMFGRGGGISGVGPPLAPVGRAAGLRGAGAAAMGMVGGPVGVAAIAGTVALAATGQAVGSWNQGQINQAGMMTRAELQASYLGDKTRGQTFGSNLGQLFGKKSLTQIRQDEIQKYLGRDAAVVLQAAKADPLFKYSAEWYNDPETYSKILGTLTSEGMANNDTYKNIMKDRLGPLFESYVKSSTERRKLYNGQLGGIPPSELWKTEERDIKRFSSKYGFDLGAGTGDATDPWAGQISAPLYAHYQAAQGTSTKEQGYELPKQSYANTAGLHPELAKRLKAMFAANPRLSVTSGFRSYAEQAAMYADRYPNGVKRPGVAPAARPGSSNHEIGMAADIGPASEYGWISAHAEEFGLRSYANINGEPWHLQPMGTVSGFPEYNKNWRQEWSQAGLSGGGGVGAPSIAGAVSTGSSTTPVSQKLGTGGMMLGAGGGASIGESFRAGLSSLGSSGRLQQILAGGNLAGAVGTGNLALPGGGSIGAGQLNAEQVAQAAYAAGFRGQDLVTMVAIAKGESGWNSTSHNPKPPDDSYGLWQINMLGSMGPARRKTFGISANEELFDPMTNARAAFSIYNSQGLGAWSVYNRKDYQKWIPTPRLRCRRSATATRWAVAPATRAWAVVAPARSWRRGR